MTCRKMAKIYYDPEKDELVPQPRQESIQRKQHFHLEEGSFLHTVFVMIMMLVLTAAFLALEALLVYAWWMHFDLCVLWFILMSVVIVLYGACMMALIKPDYIII